MVKNNKYGIHRFDFLTNLGVLYLIIAGLFVVPLCTAFVVIIINGMMDFKYAILFISAATFILFIYFLARFSKKVLEKIGSDGLYARREVEKNLSRGGPFQISLFNGLLTVNYGRRSYNDTLSLPLEPHAPKSLPPAASPENDHNGSEIISHLKELSELNHHGVIDDEELEVIKTHLIRKCEAANS